MSTNGSDFSKEERAVLDAVVGGRRAWTAGLGGVAVSQLMERGFIELWSMDRDGRRLDGGPYVTLTPWGAVQLGYELRERRWVRWVHYRGKKRGEPTYHERVLVEEPYWARSSSPSRRSVVVLPQARQCGLDYPELIPAPGLDTGYLSDEEGAPLLFFGVYKAKIDSRLKSH